MNFEKLREEQLKLSRKTILKDQIKEYLTFGGADCAFSGNRIVAGIVVCDKDLNVIEKQYAVLEAKMPYVPNFLFYRVGPAIAEAYSKLNTKPDVLLLEGNGILHPLRIGMATQLGILLDQATIGISKSLLVGNIENGQIFVGNEIRGVEMKTRDYARPLYVSPGHKISLHTSIDLVKKIIRPPHKMPEPLHLAHKYTTLVKKETQ